MNDKPTWRHKFVQWLANVLGVEVYTSPAVVVVDVSKLPQPRQDDGGPRVH